MRTPAGEVTLNFVDADLREVVKAILGDTLGANYVMDPQVQGTVTLQTSQPVAGSSLVSVLESILAVNNATLVQSEGIYKILPADQGVRGSGGVRTSLPPATQAPGAQVMAVPLRHVSATEMEKVLAPFAPPGGVLRVDPRRNLVVIGGSRSDVASMLDVIETFDVDWLAGMSFGLFPVKSTSAKTMVEELEKVFGDQAEGPLANVVRFVPIERLNAVLVISSRSQYIDRARTWVSRLDIGEGEKVRLYVYYCENSRAEDLASVLGSVFGQAEQGRPTAQVAPGLRGRTTGGRMGGLGGGAGSAFGGRGGSSGGFGGQGMGGGLLGGGLGGQTLGGRRPRRSDSGRRRPWRADFRRRRHWRAESDRRLARRRGGAGRRQHRIAPNRRRQSQERPGHPGQAQRLPDDRSGDQESSISLRCRC